MTEQPAGTGIEAGTLVTATDAEGEELPRRAISGKLAGQSFEVVWVCREEEWHAALREGRHPDGVPWPAEDVKPRSAVEQGLEAWAEGSTEGTTTGARRVLTARLPMTA